MIPQLLLEEIYNGEKDAKAYYKRYGKENIDKALSELKKSNEEIFDTYPVEKMQNIFNAKRIKNANKGKISVSKVRFIGMALAAMFAFAIFTPAILKKHSEQVQSTSEIRIKGHDKQFGLKLYKKDGDSAVSLENNEYVKEGDSLQISYSSGDNQYGCIFSIDGNGCVTRHFPENSWTAEKLTTNSNEVLLDFSYVLDDAPEFESFVFIASNEPFDLSSIEKNTKAFNLSFFVEGKNIPSNFEKTVFTVKKF